jgi:LDH2 family malate/lactate/ureidoglycolate dehydrogenase
MLGEVLTAVMSQGCILDEKSTLDGVTNNASHTAIAIKADALMSKEDFRRRTSILNSRVENLAPGIHLPGTGSHKEKSKLLEQGYVELSDGLVDELNAFAARYHINALCEA